MRILGISAFYHDSAAALVEDGKIIAAAQEERFSRIRHDSRFPSNAIEFCIGTHNNKNKKIDLVAFYESPNLKRQRMVATALSTAPLGFNWFRQALGEGFKRTTFQKRQIANELMRFNPDDDWKKKILFMKHHQSHAASAFFPSPFADAAVLTLDGVGEWATTSVAFGEGNKIDLSREIHFPHSLGLLYSAFTSYLGFKVNSGEYRVMGLAPYGQPKFAQLILDNLIDIKSDGSFSLNMNYFDYYVGMEMVNSRFESIFGMPQRLPQDIITQDHMDIAASIQNVLEYGVVNLARSVANESRSSNLCLAGGVALNCVANTKILNSGAFKNVWIQPAAGDAGGALGAALAAYYTYANKPRDAKCNTSTMQGALLGPSWKNKEIEARLLSLGAVFQQFNFDDFIDVIVQDLINGKIIGWVQGKMEFGPRALGARSILADPRSPEMQKTLNLKIKFRESFRPFGPAVLAEAAADWFELEVESPYMLLVAPVAERHRKNLSAMDSKRVGLDKINVCRSSIPAVTHMDYSARIQTVNADSNPRFYELLKAFRDRTGCPVLINTSFNIRGEPIVCTPEDAFKCFMSNEMDAMAVGEYYLNKGDQTAPYNHGHKENFDPN